MEGAAADIVPALAIDYKTFGGIGASGCGKIEGLQSRVSTLRRAAGAIHTKHLDQEQHSHRSQQQRQ